MTHRRRTGRRLTTALGLLACMGASAQTATTHTEATPPLGYSPAHMDRRISPRQDFYRYANGAWLERTSIPASEPDVGGFSLLSDELDKRLLQLIQGAATRAAAGQAVAGSPAQQVGDFWRAGQDLARRDALGLQPIQAALDQIDALPVRDPAALAAFIGRLQWLTGSNALMDLGVMPDPQDSRVNVLVLAAGPLSLAQNEYAQADAAGLRSQYLDYITRSFAALGQTPEQAARAAAAVLRLEAALAAARLPPEKAYDPALTNNMRSPAELQALVPAVDVAALFKASGLSAPTRLQVLDLGGLKAVQQQLSTASEDEVRSLLRWRLLSASAPLLGAPWRTLDERFSLQRQGLAQAPTLERSLTQLLSQKLFHPVSQLYVQAWFPEQTRRDLIEMVDHIRGEFAQRLRSNPWLDEPTRRAALDKLRHIDIQVGRPERWIDFSGVEIRPDDHLGNVQRIGAMLLRRDLASAGQPVLGDRFASPGHTTPVSVNAAYDPMANTIDITAAIAQPPFYVPGADKAVNYCTMGAVIGHEMTHGFDSLGRQYGPRGELRDWWTPKAAAAFKQRTAVLVKQYGGYEVLPGLRLNGELTIGENTADLGGITLAHAALHRALAGQPQPKVDGLDTDQRCFVAWAQLWAYKARPERTRLLAAVDYHSNSTVRSFGPLLHLDAFHQAFGTRPGDAMWRAPAQRVRIW